MNLTTRKEKRFFVQRLTHVNTVSLIENDVVTWLVLNLHITPTNIHITVVSLRGNAAADRTMLSECKISKQVRVTITPSQRLG